MKWVVYICANKQMLYQFCNNIFIDNYYFLLQLTFSLSKVEEIRWSFVDVKSLFWIDSIFFPLPNYHWSIRSCYVHFFSRKKKKVYYDFWFFNTIYMVKIRTKIDVNIFWFFDNTIFESQVKQSCLCLQYASLKGLCYWL